MKQDKKSEWNQKVEQDGYKQNENTKAGYHNPAWDPAWKEIFIVIFELKIKTTT